MVSCKYPVHPNTPTMIGWTIGGRVHCNSSCRMVTHPSTILALSGWILEFPWDPGFGLSHPFQGISFFIQFNLSFLSDSWSTANQKAFILTSEGAGTGLFLLMRSTQLVVIRGNRVCMAPSLYLDQHGEVSSQSLPSTLCCMIPARKAACRIIMLWDTKVL